MDPTTATVALAWLFSLVGVGLVSGVTLLWFADLRHVMTSGIDC